MTSAREMKAWLNRESPVSCDTRIAALSVSVTAEHRAWLDSAPAAPAPIISTLDEASTSARRRALDSWADCSAMGAEHCDTVETRNLRAKRA